MIFLMAAHGSGIRDDISYGSAEKRDTRWGGILIGISRRGRRRLAEEVGEEDEEDHEDGEDEEGKLEVFVKLATEGDGVQTLTLETGGVVIVVMMMVVVMTLRRV
jgi:hypothetical protein